MAKRSFAREVQQLRIGAGREFAGEGVALERELAAASTPISTERPS